MRISFVATLCSFPRQDELAVAVSHGGTIDVRSMVADTVTASVNQGGRILTVPQAWLFARVTQGGVITYWGDGQVKQSIEHGGVVTKGGADEINLPLSDVDPSLPHSMIKPMAEDSVPALPRSVRSAH
jgi:hypothetical protein